MQLIGDLSYIDVGSQKYKLTNIATSDHFQFHQHIKKTVNELIMDKEEDINRSNLVLEAKQLWS